MRCIKTRYNDLAEAQQDFICWDWCKGSTTDCGSASISSILISQPKSINLEQTESSRKALFESTPELWHS